MPQHNGVSRVLLTVSMTRTELWPHLACLLHDASRARSRLVCLRRGRAYFRNALVDAPRHPTHKCTSALCQCGCAGTEAARVREQAEAGASEAAPATSATAAAGTNAPAAAAAAAVLQQEAGGAAAAPGSRSVLVAQPDGTLAILTPQAHSPAPSASGAGSNGPGSTDSSSGRHSTTATEAPAHAQGDIPVHTAMSTQ